MKIPEAFQEARALADFANLNREDATAVDYFRHNYPDFAPDEWWDYKFEEDQIAPTVMPYGDDPIGAADHGAVIASTRVPVWHDAQSQVWAAWENEFKFANIFGLTALLRAVFVAPSEMVLNSSNLYLPDGDLCELSAPRLYSFHKAVLYLHQQPWRARMCKAKDCQKYFVANHPKREHCEYPDANGDTCREKNDRKRHLDHYHARGKKKRQQKNKKLRQQKQRKSSPRVPVYQSK